MQIYLDNAATTRPYDAVADTMDQVMRETYGNPSSLHRMGLAAETRIKEARRQVSGALKDAYEKIIFTAGGTESDNMAIRGVATARQRRGRHIITCKVEHPAVLQVFRRLEEEGFHVTYLDVDEECRVDAGQLREVLKEATEKKSIEENVTLVSIMHANNEVGTIQPMEVIARILSEGDENNRPLFHSDCVQSFGKVAIPIGPDLISISGHKIHGPMGAGALAMRENVNLPPLIRGGGQEDDLRSGTENVPAIAGFGLAAEKIAESIEEDHHHMRSLQDRLRQGLTDQVEDIRINTPKEGALPNILSVSFLGTRGEVLLHTLEQDGIYVSTGSACSSHKKERSHVLTAMGLSDEEIEGTLRFSLSRFNTEDEMDFVASKVASAVEHFRRLGSYQ